MGERFVRFSKYTVIGARCEGGHWWRSWWGGGMPLTTIKYVKKIMYALNSYILISYILTLHHGLLLNTYRFKEIPTKYLYICYV